MNRLTLAVVGAIFILASVMTYALYRKGDVKVQFVVLRSLSLKLDAKDARKRK